MWLDDPDLPAARKLRAGLPRDFWIGTGMPGLATVKLTGAGRFEFADSGLTALIVPCYDGLPCLLDANPERHVEELRDLVAVDVDHPDRYWRRRDDALVLGSAYLGLAGQHRLERRRLRRGGADAASLDPRDHRRDPRWQPERCRDHHRSVFETRIDQRSSIAPRSELATIRFCLSSPANLSRKRAIASSGCCWRTLTTAGGIRPAASINASGSLSK